MASGSRATAFRTGRAVAGVFTDTVFITGLVLRARFAIVAGVAAGFVLIAFFTFIILAASRARIGGALTAPIHALLAFRARLALAAGA